MLGGRALQLGMIVPDHEREPLFGLAARWFALQPTLLLTVSEMHVRKVTPADLERLVLSLRPCRLAVIGDAMLDRYVKGSMTGSAPRPQFQS